MKNEKKIRIILNALKPYLGKDLCLDDAVDVFRLIKLIERFDASYVDLNFELSKGEKEILLKALNNHQKRFLRMDSTFNIARLIKEIQKSIPINTSLSSLGKKWVLPDIP